jgi:hypothetical protein
MSTEYADIGFKFTFSKVEMSDLGPPVLSCFAFFILAQGLIYILRPEMTGRSLTTPKEKIRRIGLYITLAAGTLLYIALSWWVNSWS